MTLATLDMPPSLLTPAFAAFALAMAATPGPINVALLGAGSRAGVDGGSPMLVGAVLARAVIWGAAGGLSRRIAAADPTVFAVLKAMGIAFLLWFAWRVATAPPPETEAELAPRGARRSAWRAARRRFVAGALIAASNPMSWLGALMAGTQFCDPASSAIQHAVGFGAACGVIGLVAGAPWLATGALLRRRLRSAGAHRALSVGGAALMLGSLAAVL